MSVRVFNSLFLLLLVACAVAQSTTECSGALLIPPPYTTPISVFGTTSGAASVSSATPCTSYAVDAPGVYYEIQPQSGSSVTVSLCSQDTAFDTILQVFGSDCSECTVQNDDACDLASEVTFTASDSSYYVLVTGYSGASGTFEMTVSEDAVDESGCDHAFPIPGPYTTPVSVFGNTNGKEPVNGECNLDTYSPADWYQIFPTIGNEVHISTCNNNTNYDTVIAVLSDCDTMMCIAQNDDNCDSNNGLASSVSFLAEAPSYYVFVAGYTDETGNYVMTIGETESGTSCNNATPFPAPAPGLHTQLGGELVSNDGMPVCDNEGSNPVWYKLQGAIAGSTYNATTCDPHTNADTIIAVVSGACNANQTCLAYNDDMDCGITGESFSSTVTFTVTDPEDTYIVVMGWGSEVGSYMLIVSSGNPPPSSQGDSCASAVSLVVDTSGSVHFNGSLPAQSTSPPVSLCSYSISNSQYWIKLDGVDSGMGLEVSTCSQQTTVDTILFVVSAPTDTCGSSFYCIASNDDYFSCLLNNLSSDVKFAVPLAFDPTSQDLYVVVSEYSEETGTFGLTVTVTLP